MIDELSGQIYTAYNGDATLKAALSGGMWNTEPKQDSDLPYGLFLLVSDVPNFTAASAYMQSLIQFSMFSDATGQYRNSVTEIVDIYNKLVDVYGDQAAVRFVSTNWVFLFWRARTSLFKADEAWTLTVDYRVDASSR